MQKKYTETDFMEMARQLSHPEGEGGIEAAERMNIANDNMTRCAVNSLDIKNSEKILEIGPGNARHLHYILQRAESVFYYGIDISDTMVAEAKNINSEFVDRGNTFFELTDGKIIPYPDAFFDKVFTVNTVYFWESPVEYLLEIKRILKPGGLFALAFAERDFMEKLPFTKYGFMLYNRQEVKQLLSEAGFSNLGVIQETENIISNSGNYTERSFLIITAAL